MNTVALSLKDIAKSRLTASKESNAGGIEVTHDVKLPWHEASYVETQPNSINLKKIEHQILEHHKRIMKLEESLETLTKLLTEIKKS